MDIGSFFLLLGLFILVALYISRPFVVRTARSVSPEEKQLSHLFAEQERLITALQELDFDHSLGKIPEADYPTQRSTLLSQAAETMRQLDQLRAAPAEDGQTQIKTVVASHRQKKRPPSIGSAPDDELEALIASRRRERSEKAGGFCPQCGRPIQLSDKFCPHCGAALSVEEHQMKKP